MATGLEKLWQSTLAELELQISRPNFITWFKNSQLLEKKTDGQVVIGLFSNFAKEWVENKYHKLLLDILFSLDNSIKKIEYTVINRPGPVLIKQPKRITDLSADNGFEEFKIDPESNLHPRYTFNSFVVGSSNELAYAASQAVIKVIGRKYNPLFVYGGTGLGKTHLIQAIGNEIKNVYKNKCKTKYVSSEKFVNDVVFFIRNKRMEDMKIKYRNIDVLIIDDIQFIGGKERSEEELFHTFNALYENNKQIIISSDRAPSALPVLEERLRSRFEGGMIADITYPDYEMRLAIIKNKLQERRSYLSDEVCSLVATKVQRNIRELEGVLNKVVFYQDVKGVDLTTKIVEEIIDNTLQEKSSNVSSGKIIKAVADFYEMSPKELTERSRKKNIVEPRQIAMFLMRDILDMSYPNIGEKLGKRDHTTAIYAYEKISQEITKKQSFNQKITNIKDLIYKSG
ncbi:chromosomal replication initiator protein DnaA [Candidatus Berkelbacteria bacterium CG10_big_fil_rev_8_21_14_0_10_41_12]|uniref:Chromosomal replication initiator protein DnaA n=1 Tax=Candidatus Berkelbacteria bacterium CG10_big_fil_rev_8_21_14_0_10_41_12 TaxID=1974513 RepID=A0A2M6WWA3_9BACT|nr:MAG: chromosomal replication initiator protein DnaA [Candidatus Berkelbacteria bacterium CG10_big_fil_rev_8_21_14_0_10_41_12]